MEQKIWLIFGIICALCSLACRRLSLVCPCLSNEPIVSDPPSCGENDFSWCPIVVRLASVSPHHHTVMEKQKEDHHIHNRQLPHFAYKIHVCNYITFIFRALSMSRSYPVSLYRVDLFAFRRGVVGMHDPRTVY